MLLRGPTGEESLILEKYLGGGSFGDVYKARETPSGTPYAVKFPRISSLFGDNTAMIAFLNEVQAAKEIHHPNVVNVVYVNSDSAELLPYLVMEYMEGGTLQSRLGQLRASGSLADIKQIQVWNNGLIEGIAAINSKMLHRDLKPDNILMDGDSPKIGDFGLSKIINALTRSRTFKGGQHVLYMAPEGWKFETNQI